MKHRARKRFGQNFLADKDVVERIVEAVGPVSSTPIVEIGPGLAALSLPLLARHERLTVIELDRDLVARLQSRQLKGLEVLQGDALNTDFLQLANQLATDRNRARLRIVGNLPYNVGTPLILKLAREHSAVESIHVMLQREVIDRLVAQPGSKQWGRLAVMMNSVFSIRRLFDVPPSAFDPQPKVWSAVARLTPLPTIPPDESLQALESVARLAFANRRKTLRNNFKGALDDAVLERCGVDPGLRAERLELTQLHALAEHLRDHGTTLAAGGFDERKAR